MARLAGGQEHVNRARDLLLNARSAEELRTAQAVLLPLLLGLSIEQTGVAIGRSASAAAVMRSRFCRVASGEMSAPLGKRQLRNRAFASVEEERLLLARVCGVANQMPLSLVPRLREAMQAQFGQSVALSSVYRLSAAPRLVPCGAGSGRKANTPAFSERPPQQAGSALGQALT